MANSKLINRLRINTVAFGLSTAMALSSLGGSIYPVRAEENTNTNESTIDEDSVVKEAISSLEALIEKASEEDVYDAVVIAFYQMIVDELKRNNIELPTSEESVIEETEKQLTFDDIFGKKEEKITAEDLQKIAVDFYTKYQDKLNNSGVELSKVLAFVWIANVNEINRSIKVEDQRQLMADWFDRQDQTSEGFLNDAAKIVGFAVMNNMTEWTNNQSTENFIWLSDVVYGEANKEKMGILEDYVRQIAEATLNNDADKANELSHDAILALNSGKLSKMDDGVGFVAVIHMATLDDVIGRNIFDQYSRNHWAVLKSSEKYVANILRLLEGCLTKTVSHKDSVDNVMRVLRAYIMPYQNDVKTLKRSI